MKSTKNYIIVHNELEIIIFDSLKNVEVSTPETNTIYENDNLQECIDYLLLNEIDTFNVPILLSGLDIDKKYRKQIYSEILVRYENGIPVYSYELSGYTEMSTEEKKEVDRNIYRETKKNKFCGYRYMLEVDYNYIITNYVSFAIMMLAKETVKNDVRLNEQNVRVVKLWFDSFETENDKQIIDNDNILKSGLYDVEDLNPDNF